MTDVMPLRARNRLNAMMAVQDAAYELFAERGFDAVTVNQIAERSGVAPATVYRHFGTKDHIVTTSGRGGTRTPDIFLVRHQPLSAALPRRLPCVFARRGRA